MDDLVVEKVLRAVELVPAGQVVAYGELGRIVGTGARQVGAVMASHGSSVAWWRVTNATGELPSHLLAEARTHWSAEGIEAKADGRGCLIGAHRCDLVTLEHAWQRATQDLR